MAGVALAEPTFACRAAEPQSRILPKSSFIFATKIDETKWETDDREPVLMLFHRREPTSYHPIEGIPLQIQLRHVSVHHILFRRIFTFSQHPSSRLRVRGRRRIVYILALTSLRLAACRRRYSRASILHRVWSRI
jgi:hypothetical protein